MALLCDARHAVRSLRRRPGFVATALASLALGVGANSALYSVVDAVLLKPLPLTEPDRLFLIKEAKSGRPSNSNPQRLRDWQEQVPAFESVAAWYGESVVWTAAGEPRMLNVLRTFGRVSKLLGATPAIGRTFTRQEERGEGEPVVLLGHGFWRKQFGGAPDALGRPLKLGGAVYTVIGVMPESLRYPDDVDVWTPGPLEVQQSGRQAGFLEIIARLAPGVSPTLAQSQADAVAIRLRQQYPATDSGLSAQLAPLQAEIATEARAPLLVLLGAAGFVLLLACVNLAGLLLARAAERARESSIRAALGAGRGGLVRLFLLESLLLSLAGGLLGLLVAATGIDLLRAYLPPDLPRLSSAALDLRVAGFAAALSVLCALLFGLAPAWHSSRPNLTAGLKEGAAATAGLGRDGRFRAMLVVVQIGLSVMLVVGAGLLAFTFLRLRQTPLGFQPAQVLTVSLDLPWNTPAPELRRFHDTALERFRAIPGVRLAGYADRLPLGGGSQTRPVAVRGRTLPPELEKQPVSMRGVAGDFFQALRVPLLAGRWPAAPREVLVNREFVNRYLLGSEPLGRSVSFQPGDWLNVVGVVEDLRQEAARPAPPAVFLAMREVYWPLANFVLRAQGDPRTLTAAVRDQVRQINPQFIPGPIRTMEEALDRSVARERTRAILVSGFALLALALACVGVYGLLAGDVARRRQEIGIRLALGARPADVQRMALRRAAALAAFGIVLGLAAARALSGLLETLLYGVRPTETGIYLGAAAVAGLAALSAAWIPARRAARVDPLTSLRHE